MKYGNPPTIIKNISLEVIEGFSYMYLPIKMNDGFSIEIPKRLHFLKKLIGEVVNYEGASFLENHYIYLTAKNRYIEKGSYSNRKGWHSDGFGTEDINYIWSNNTPTVFCEQEFNLSKSHEKSLLEMQEQALCWNEKTYPNNTLLRLTESQIHRVAESSQSGMRCFIKISISKEKYNLKGNSHNYLFDYKWKMYDRWEQRNHPILNNSDFVKKNNNNG